MKNYLNTRIYPSLILLLCLMTSGVQSHAQWYWAYQATGGTQSARMCSYTSSGHTYIAGGYNSTSTFGSTTLSDMGNGDGYVSKLNTGGTFAWTVGINGTLAGQACVIAASGSDVFVAGTFRGNATVGTTSGSPLSLSGSNFTDNFFIARYNSSGVLQWVQTLASLGNCDPRDIEINTSLQRIYVTGTNSTGGFALSYDYAGVLQTNVAMSSTGACKVGGITCDASGNSHLLLGFSGTLTVAGTNFTATPGSGERLLLVKLNSTGVLTASSVIGQGTSSGFTVRPEDVDIDLAGNLYIASDYQSGSLILSGTTIPNSGILDACVAKYTSAYALVWYNKTNGAGSETIDALSTDNSGNVFAGVNNRENNSLNFTCYAAFPSVLGNVDNKMVVLKYTTAGNLDWAIAPLASNGFSSISTIAPHGSGSAVVCGSHTGTTTFGSNVLSGVGYLFATRVKGTSQLPVVNGASICSGSTATLTVTAPAGATFNWYTSTTSPTPFHTGSTYTTPILTNTTTMPTTVTYYVSNSLCNSIRVPVVVQINPNPDLSSVVTNFTICKGSCATIGLQFPVVNTTYALYNSTSGTSVLIGNVHWLSVCPTKSSIYTLVATNQYGCTSSVTIHVTVVSNDPSFSITSTPSGSYLNVSATPTISYATANSVAGFAYTWKLEELDALNNPLFTVNNSSCWQNFSSVATLVFNGFDHAANAYSGSVTLSSCSTPAIGKFLLDRTYRITRATKNNFCDWTEYSQTITASRNEVTGIIELHILQNNGESMVSQLPSMGETGMNVDDVALTLYPNPTNGVFTVESELLKNATVVVTDLLGNQIQSIRLNEKETKKQVDLSDYASGVYLVRVTINNQVITRRVILQ
jgi:hypothetical protein